MSKLIEIKPQEILNYDDPFLKDNFNGLALFVQRHLMTGKFVISSQVEFKNKNTEGKQNFQGDSIESVLTQMKVFIDNLKAKQ